MINIGVIGCGSISRARHIPEYAENEKVNLTAFCDVVLSRAEEQVETHGGKAYEDYKELLANPDIDAVSVCTPNYLHAEITMDALKAGKHVLCEKPMGVTVDEMDRMIEVEKESGRQLMIAHNQRLIKEHQVAREWIDQDKLGKIYSFRTSFGHPGPDDWSVDGKDSWFFKEEEAIMGAMGDLGVHKADVIRYILNEEFNQVAGFITTEAKHFSTVDDNAVCILRSESNVIGTLHASWSYNGKEDNSTIIYAENGILELLNDDDYPFIFTSKEGEVVKENYGGIQTNDGDGQSLSSHVIDTFVDALERDERVPMTAEDVKKSVEIILNAFKSNETDQIITVK
ncbi:Gfo/Idh/MocA family protein [Salinicoccus sp. YB14-2]|uniref:Gfo/Idh/MocA family protein n=1 Tax=Salinicoccus sp. YB14-2 TaxID=1572701 RepID=UPI00068C9F06|nr:Gfo/Idh/MocA family oxidoreductase [Salinicoccus sp. YB14-2]